MGHNAGRAGTLPRTAAAILSIGIFCVSIGRQETVYVAAPFGRFDHRAQIAILLIVGGGVG
jgi:hypothetical protein